MNYLLLIGLFFQLISNTGKTEKKEFFFPPTRTVSYTVTDPTAFNAKHVYVLTDTFLGIRDYPEFKIKHAYVYNEHSTDLYNGHLHWLDSPMVIVLDHGYWQRLFTLRWKDAKKSDIVYIPPMEVVDDNIQYNWMPEKLWIGETWKGKGSTGGNDWTSEFNKVVDHRNGIWYIHSISVYLQSKTTQGSCYDQRYKNGVLIYQKMTDCRDHLTGEIHAR